MPRFHDVVSACHARDAARRWVRRSLLPVLMAAVGSVALAQGAASETELETWRAASRLDTPAAYQAYLAAYPQGAFAAFARLALARGAREVAGSTPPAAAPAAPATAPTASAVLKSHRAALHTNMFDMLQGDRLLGPGVLTIGSLGSRRQLVVPAGEWVVLAGYDHRSPHPQPVSMVTLVLGQFGGDQLRSLLAVSFNRRAVTNSSPSPQLQALGLLPRWSASEACEATVPGQLAHAVRAGRDLQLCQQALPVPAPDPGSPAFAAFSGVAGLTDALEPALAVLGGKVMPPALRSELHITDLRLGNMVYTRWDTTARADIAARLQAFSEVARRAYEREFDAADLRPGQAAVPPGFSLEP